MRRRVCDIEMEAIIGCGLLPAGLVIADRTRERRAAATHNGNLGVLKGHKAAAAEQKQPTQKTVKDNETLSWRWKILQGLPSRRSCCVKLVQL